MREPTEREIFLQNLLATSSTLLYRSVQAMERGAASTQEALIIEIEEWFAEAQAQIKSALREDQQAKPVEPATVQVVWVARVEPPADEKLNYFLR